MMSDWSNTNPEVPLRLGDSAELRLRVDSGERGPAALAELGPTLRAAAGDPERAEAVYAQIAAAGGPLVEPTDDPDHRLVSLVFRSIDHAERVDVVGLLCHHGERTAAPPIHTHAMRRLGETDLWGLTIRARRDLRTTYRFLPSSGDEPTRWQVLTEAVVDPLNARMFGGGESDGYRVPVLRQPESILELDRAPYAELGLRCGDRFGWTRHWFRGEARGDVRRIWTWSPQRAPVGLVLLHDGYDWSQRTRITAILHELIERGLLPPLLVVAVEALRGLSTTELGCDDGFTDSMVCEVLPWARACGNLPDDPSRVILAGQSWGGLNVMYTALRYPDAAQGILSQSGSFWYSPDVDPDGYGRHGWLVEQFRDRPAGRHRFHLQVGALEGDLVTINRHLRDVLIAKGYEVTWAETNDDHSWYSWQFGLVDGLIALTRDWFELPSRG